MTSSTKSYPPAVQPRIGSLTPLSLALVDGVTSSFCSLTQMECCMVFGSTSFTKDIHQQPVTMTGLDPPH